MASEGPPLAVEGLVLDGEGRNAPILAIPRLELAGGGQTALIGPSGCGKTSLLFVLAGLTVPSRGLLRWGEDEPYRMGEARRDAWRRQRIGLIFQKPQLVPELDILANLMLKAHFGGGRAIKREEALALIERLNLPHHGRRAALLSQGEQQRVALARALLYRPAILLADEPTASLDADNAALVADLLREEAAKLGATLVCATHDPRLMAAMPTLRLNQGRLAEDRP